MNILKWLFKNRDRRVSVLVFAFSIVWLIMAKDIKSIFNYAGNRDPGSKLFPYMIGILLLITSVGKFITCNQEDDSNFYETNRSWLKVLAAFALLSLYVWSFNKIGWHLSTFLAGILFVLLMKEERKVNWYSPIIFSGVLTGIMWLLFVKILSIVLPTGTLWQMFR